MRHQASENVPALTGLLSAVSLALVFGAALGYVPRTLLPAASGEVLAAIPHVNAVISTLAVVAIGLGWYWIRAGDVRRHRLAMLAAFGLFVAFLALYLYKVALAGPTAFPGPDAVRTYVYLPLLAVHVLLAIVCIPLLYYVLLLAWVTPVADLPATAHPRVGRVAATLWLLSFVLGNVVYVLLYAVYQG